MSKRVFTGKTLEIALKKASALYGLAKEAIPYTLTKDAKTGIFGIVPVQDIEIVVELKHAIEDEGALNKQSLQEKKSKKERVVKKNIEEVLVPFSKLSRTDMDTIIFLLKTAITKIVRAVSVEANIEIDHKEDNIYVRIEKDEDTKVLIGEDTEVLVAIQYILYKIVTQHIRCLFSLFLYLGEATVSEETILISMVRKLVEKVKNTHKTQRTYPLTRIQRGIVEKVIEEEAMIEIKPQKTDTPMQPIVLVYKK